MSTRAQHLRPRAEPGGECRPGHNTFGRALSLRANVDEQRPAVDGRLHLNGPEPLMSLDSDRLYREYFFPEQSTAPSPRWAPARISRTPPGTPPATGAGDGAT